MMDLFGIGLESVTRSPDHEIVSGLRKMHGKKGKWADVTSGGRIMWKGSRWKPDVFVDIDPGKSPDLCASFYDLPFPDASLVGVVFDPPHLPAHYGSGVSEFRGRYGLRHGVPKFAPAFSEIYRVLKPGGLVLSKLCDYVDARKYVWVLVDAVNAMRECSIRPADLVIKVRSSGPVSGSWKTQDHTRRVHSWWVAGKKTTGSTT